MRWLAGWLRRVADWLDPSPPPHTLYDEMIALTVRSPRFTAALSEGVRRNNALLNKLKDGQ